MSRILLMILALGLVSACGDGNPIINDEEPTDETPTDGGGDEGGGDEGGGDEGEPIDSSGELPPGTSSPSRSNTIFRYEPQDDDGSGFIDAPTYNATADTFTVSNLPFDGDSPYARAQEVGSLGDGRFAVYEAENIAIDPLTGNPITQFQHKAIYAVSDSGRTEMAIVRTGAYVPYGFGGFVYQRNGAVTLPVQGQATFSGDYAGLRDFDGAGGIQYVQGDATINIDFEAFEVGAVDGAITNRAYFDTQGNDITEDYLTSLGEAYDSNFTQVPVILFTIADGVLDANGELNGEAYSLVTSNSSAVEEFETGQFYGVLAGPDASEVAGIIVVTSDDPGRDGVTARETGGFIATR